MTPGEASRAGRVLLVDHPLGGLRSAAHVFDLEQGGIAYLDSGWTDNQVTSHAAHLVEHELEPADIGYGASWIALNTPDGDVLVEPHPSDPAQEGDRQLALEVLRGEFPGVKILE